MPEIPYTGPNADAAYRFLEALSALSVTRWLHAADRYAPLRELPTFRQAHDAMYGRLELTKRIYAANALAAQVRAMGDDVRASLAHNPAFAPAAWEVAEWTAITAVLAIAARDLLSADHVRTLLYPFDGIVPMPAITPE